MKLLLAAAFIALAFTTGFTCSKNTPPVAPPAVAPAMPEQPAAPTPGEGTTPAPVEGAAAPAPETK